MSLYQFGAYTDQFGIGPVCFQAVNSAAGGLFKFPGCDGWTQKSAEGGRCCLQTRSVIECSPPKIVGAPGKKQFTKKGCLTKIDIV
jgi:hypothetical protein